MPNETPLSGAMVEATRLRVEGQVRMYEAELLVGNDQEIEAAKQRADAAHSAHLDEKRLYFIELKKQFLK